MRVSVGSGFIDWSGNIGFVAQITDGVNKENAYFVEFAGAPALAIATGTQIAGGFKVDKITTTASQFMNEGRFVFSATMTGSLLISNTASKGHPFRQYA